LSFRAIWPDSQSSNFAQSPPGRNRSTLRVDQIAQRFDPATIGRHLALQRRARRDRQGACCWAGLEVQLVRPGGAKAASLMVRIIALQKKPAGPTQQGCDARPGFRQNRAPQNRKSTLPGCPSGSRSRGYHQEMTCKGS
jgi:hypothetical protein